MDAPRAVAGPPADRPASESDDTLILLFMCCHPSLSSASQIALTLRGVGGLTTAEIARAFLVPEETMTRRITRAKQQIKESGIPFRMPEGKERSRTLGAVLHVLYLIFNEGYASTSGPSLYRGDLAAEAIRRARMVHQLLPDESEVAGLLALMLLTDARRPARTSPEGELIAMAEQDRTLWNADAIAEGVALITDALPKGPVGPYQIQAAIAAIHDEAQSADETDWRQIVELYALLLQIADNPVVALNHAVAVRMARGPQAGLDLLDTLQGERCIVGDHRFHAVRAHLLEMAGDRAAARDAYLSTRDARTHAAIDELSGQFDTTEVTRACETALRAPVWDGPPVWTHGDLLPGNMLVHGGRICAVIDFGCLGIGDPACDLIVAWALLSAQPRGIFREALSVDEVAWARGRGWALSIGLIALPYYQNSNPVFAATARRMIAEALADHVRLWPGQQFTTSRPAPSTASSPTRTPHSTGTSRYRTLPTRATAPRSCPSVGVEPGSISIMLDPSSQSSLIGATPRPLSTRLIGCIRACS